MDGSTINAPATACAVNRRTILRSLFLAAVVLMPFSYGTKLILGKEEMLWVAPTLILAFLIFMLERPAPKPLVLLFLVVSSLISAGFGLLLNESDGSAFEVLYGALREPLRLTLNVAWFFVCAAFFRSSLPRVLKWLSIGVMLQLCITLYMGLGMFKLVPLSESLDSYLKYYIARQSLWFGDIFIPRFGGTFFESPPFGLYMFSTLSVLLLSYHKGVRGGWVVAGILFSSVGAIASFSDQIFGGMLVIAPWLVTRYLKNRLKWSKVWSLALLIPLFMLVLGGFGYYVSLKFLQKQSEIGYTSDVTGMSGAERHFHFQYGLDMLAERPVSALFGVGPGRYGDYVASTGIFPNTVTIQLSPMELLVEYGIAGILLAVVWLSSLYRKSFTDFGPFGVCVLTGLLIANSVQSSWKWEAWFMALAFIYSGAASIHSALPAEESDENVSS